MTGIFRIILIFLVIYYAMKLLLRLFMPWILKWVTQSMAKRYGFNPTDAKTEFKSNEKPKSKTPKVGEYVDYEEIDE